MGDIPEGNMKNGTEENGIPENSVLVSEDKDAHKEGRYQSVNFFISSIGTIKSCLLVKPLDLIDFSKSLIRET